MGCSKPDWVPCPQTGATSPNCLGCGYHFYDTVGYTATTPCALPKYIHQFTTDELLAEIRRRCGT